MLFSHDVCLSSCGYKFPRDSIAKRPDNKICIVLAVSVEGNQSEETGRISSAPFDPHHMVLDSAIVCTNNRLELQQGTTENKCKRRSEEKKTLSGKRIKSVQSCIA